MRRIVGVGFLWMMVAVLAACSSTTHDTPPAARAPSGGSPAATAMAAAAAGHAVIVDVREADEVAGGMAAPARWMPTSLIRDGGDEWERFVSSLDGGTPVYLYCESGGRSDWAAGRLRARGLQASNIGGYRDWVRAGGAVRTPARDELEPGR